MLKPAETTPLTTLKLAEYAAEILPKGVLNVITGHGDPAGHALVTHADVDMVSLTGSVETGKWIARAAADTLKRVHLELGGKAPVVVFDDVDMETALETIAGTGYYNAGQDCTAATRVLASSKVHDDVVAGLVEQASGLVIGDTRSAGHDARAAQLRAPARARRGLPRAHARITPRSSTGGREPDRPGFFLEPTVVAGLQAGRRDDPARDLRAGDHRAAVHRRGARRSRGPTGPPTAWRRRSGHATSAARCALPTALRFGCVWINDHIPLASEMPHGGFKQSGYGKDLSMYALEDYTEVKHVMVSLS